MKLHRLLVVAALALTAGRAGAHEVLYQVQRSQAVAIHVYESDGDPVAGETWEVYAPGAPQRPWQTGRTDGAGWLAFVPSAPGTWRVRVIQAAGHGLDVALDVGPGLAPAGAAASPGGAPPPADATTPGAAFVLRPLVGLAVIGLVFAALILAWRRKGAPPRP